jgi:hypothetical protein
MLSAKLLTDICSVDETGNRGCQVGTPGVVGLETRNSDLGLLDHLAFVSQVCSSFQIFVLLLELRSLFLSLSFTAPLLFGEASLPSSFLSLQVGWPAELLLHKS